MSGAPETNPYQSPSYSSQPYSGTDAMNAGGVTPRTLEMLRQTQPWVRFISVLLIIGAALMIVVGLFSVASIAVIGAAFPGRLGPFFAMYVVIGILYLMPAIYLSRYAGNINQLRNTLHVSQLENALEAQKSFWKFMGIMALVVLIMYGLAIVWFVLIGVSRVSRM